MTIEEGRRPEGGPTKSMIELMSGLRPVGAATVKAVLSFEEPAYVGMPVWVHVSLPEAEGVSLVKANMRYPFSAQPWSFGGYDFEVTRGGNQLARINLPPSMRPPPEQVSCAPATSPIGRFPLHLHYRFDLPGTYRVIFGYWRLSPPAIVVSSDWTDLVVEEFSADRRSAWLQEKEAAPPEDVGKLVGDYLPSLLACPDDRVLDIVLDYVHHPDGDVLAYAIHSLFYFTGDSLRREIPPLIRRKGAGGYLALFLNWKRDVFQPVGEELVDALIPFLRADSAWQAGGALRALGFLKGHYSWDDKPDVPERIDQAVWQAVDHLLIFKEWEALHPLCLFMGHLKADRAREVLWKLSANAAVREKALICIALIGDARDLPRLGQLLLQDDESRWFLPYHLRKAYGRDAIPSLKGGLDGSANQRVRLYCARALAFEGVPEAFLFFRDAIAHDRPYKSSVVSFLRDHFRLNRDSTDDQALSLLDSKLRELSSTKKR